MIRGLRDWFAREIARAPTAYAVLLIVSVAFLAYSNSLEGGFHFDDSHHVVKNPYVRSLEYLPQYFYRPDTFSAVPGHEMYRPLVMCSFALNYHWGGYDPLGWRLTAVALHTLCAVGVFFLFRVLAGRFSPRTDRNLTTEGALVAALFLAVHPVFTETVNYASARSSLIAACCAIWAIYLHFRASACRSATRRATLLAVSALLLGAGLLAKEIVVVVPFILLWGAYLARRGYLAVLPSLLVVFAYLYVRRVLLGSATIDLNPRDAAVAALDPNNAGTRPVLWNLYTQARVVSTYILLFFLPAGLCVFRFVRVSQTPWEPGVIGGTILIAALLYGAWRWRRKSPVASLGIVWFFLALAPTSTLIPLIQLMNERRLYLAGAGGALAAGAVWLLLSPRVRSRLAPAAALAGVVLLSVTLSRNRDWRDSLRLWESAVAVSPQSAPAWNSYSVELGMRGRYEEAFEGLRRARELNPHYWPPIFNAGALRLQSYRDAGEKDAAILDEAELWFDRALERQPASERARWQLAETHYHMGRIEKAESEFLQLAGLNPRLFEMTRYPLARIALDRGDVGRARAFYEEALHRGTDPVSAHLGLGRLALERGDRRGAEEAARRAMEARPHSPEPHLFLARVHKGTPLATRYLFEAERRGYRPRPGERNRILGRS